jgi:hypothetical protein
LNELAEHLKPDQVGYGLVRRTDRIDESETGMFRLYVIPIHLITVLLCSQVCFHTVHWGQSGDYAKSKDQCTHGGRERLHWTIPRGHHSHINL